TLAMIAAAVAGARAYSFAAYLLVSEAIATGLAWRASDWRPHHAPRWSSVRGLLKTGADVTGYQVLAHLTQQIDAIIVGRFFGAYALGLYNRANQLLLLPQLHVATPLNQVAMVTLSRIGCHSRDFIHHARSTATVVTHLVLPLFAVCIVLPQETVRLILGAQWPHAAPLLGVLAVAATAATITSLAYAINVAAGQTRRLVFSAAVALPLTAVAAWLGAQRGPIGVAENIALVNVALVLPRLWWALRGLPEGLFGYARALLGPIVAAVVFSIGLWLGRSSVEESNWAVRLGVATGGGVLALVLLAAVWPRLRKEWRLVAASLPLPWSREK
ncbi:MAG TPA: oligosaccharide flippase family protein, partial [Opitutus sp.]|nr:oligosaccharide flippase family protein [Opitutus sp.]